MYVVLAEKNYIRSKEKTDEKQEQKTWERIQGQWHDKIFHSTQQNLLSQHNFAFEKFLRKQIRPKEHCC